MLTAQQSYTDHQSSKTQSFTEELQAQHTIQGQDLLDICAIASQETQLDNIYEQLETWRFEQFFGLACHLFITTESPQSRVQLATLLPKFGSAAVYSLLRISHKFDPAIYPQKEVQQLSIRSLKEIPLPALVIGIVKAIEESNNSDDFLSEITPTLITLAAHHRVSLFSELAKQLSSEKWNNLQTKLLRKLSEIRRSERFENRERRVKVRIKHETLQPAEMAC